MSLDKDEIRELTAELRADPAPMLRRLRALLAEKEVDPAAAWLAQFFPDDTQFQFGVLVAGDGRVYQFGYDYLHRDEAEGDLNEWKELTQGWRCTPYASRIEAALAHRAAAT